MTFKEFEAAKREVIAEYGKRLSQCVSAEGSRIGDGILSFTARNIDELPDRIPGDIRDGIADYAGIEPNTFKQQLSQARKQIQNYVSRRLLTRKASAAGTVHSAFP